MGSLRSARLPANSADSSAQFSAPPSRAFRRSCLRYSTTSAPNVLPVLGPLLLQGALSKMVPPLAAMADKVGPLMDDLLILAVAIIPKLTDAMAGFCRGLQRNNGPTPEEERRLARIDDRRLRRVASSR